MHVKHYYAQMKAREPSPVYSELYNHTRIVIGTSEFSRKKTFTRFYLSTTRVAVLCRTAGTRKRGRPRRRWTDDIKDWTELSVAECVRTAQDRTAVQKENEGQALDY